MAEPIGGGALVRVFGRLTVTDPDGSVRVPRGQARTLLLFLALRGGAVHVEQAIDALWPGEDVEVGRVRLRKVLAHLRADCGPVVIREGRCLVLIAPTDLQAFDRAASAALAIRDPEAARAALALAVGQLAPDVLYEDWSDDPRRAVDARLDALRAVALA